MSHNYYKSSGINSDASTTTVTQDSSSTRMMFFTEYHFNAVAVTEIKLTFDKKLRDRELEAYHDWVELSQAFRIKCFPGDSKVVGSLFRFTLADFIQKEITTLKAEDENEDEKAWEEIEDVFNPEDRLSSNKIQRLAVWKNDLLRQSPSASIKHGYSETVTSNTLQIVTFPKEFGNLKFRHIWSCLNDKEVCDLIVPDHMLPELRRITSCEFIKNSAEGKVFVAGNSQQLCDQALLKLDNIRKYRFSQGCHTNHLFYSEGEENVRFVLKHFSHISKKLFKSTILDNLHVHINEGNSDYENLLEVVRLQCALYNPKKAFFIPIAHSHTTISIEVRQPGLKEWASFVYSSRGNADQCPVIVNFSGVPTNAPPIVDEVQEDQYNQRNRKKPERNAKILLWANQVPQINTQPTHHPLLGRVANQQISGLAGQAIQTHDYGNNKTQQERPAWDTYIDWDAKPGQSKFGGISPQISNGLVTNLAALKGSLHDITLSPIKFSKPVLSQKSPSSTRPPVRNKVQIAAQILKPPTIQQSAILPQSNPLKASVTQLPPNRRSRTPILPLQAPLIPQNPAAPSSLTVLQAPVGITGLNPPVAMQHLHNNFKNSMLCAVPLVAPHTVSVKTPPVATYSATAHPVDERCLLDDDIFEPLNLAALRPNKISEQRQQSADEMSTRTFQNTMRQLAGKSKKPNAFAGRLEIPVWPKQELHISEVIEFSAIDPLPEFIADIDQVFNDMVNSLRGFRGELTIQLDFGRILLRNFNPKKLSDKDGEKVLLHDAAEIRDMLLKPTAVGPTSYFTKVLTTKAGEMPHILDMKDKSNTLLWEQTVMSWNVVYKFTFKDTLSSTYFAVEIDGESFVTRLKTKKELGSIFVHGTKRYHDFQISATGYESDKTEEKYGHVATALERSLWIPSNKTKPLICWILECGLLQQFNLEDLTVRRVCKFKSKDKNNKSILNVSDLQALDISGAWLPGKIACVFHGIPGSEDRKPCVKLNAWQEVSITLPQFSEVFEVNKRLELGEEAAWTAQTISGAAWDMCTPACQMMKQMDSFGWADENGVPIQQIKNKAILESQVPHPQQQQRQNPDSFW